MLNPFKTPLANGVTPNTQIAILPTGMINSENDHFDFPAPAFEWEAWDPGFTNSPGGYLDDKVQAHEPNAFPHYTGHSGVHRIQWEPGLQPTSNYNSVIAAPGSVDMSQPRDIGSIPNVNNNLVQTGPVDGNGVIWSGYIAKLRSAQPGVIGPVAGGQDYANQVAQTNNAAYAQLLSMAAAANSIVSAV